MLQSALLRAGNPLACLLRRVGLAFQIHPSRLIVYFLASCSWVTVRKSVERGLEARRTCPLFGVVCFACAFFASLFGAASASADTPPAAIKTLPLPAAAAVLGVTNPYVVAAALEKPKPKVMGFTFSRDLVDFAQRLETLARYGVELNQRKAQAPEKLNLRVQSRLGGGVLQICYRR